MSEKDDDSLRNLGGNDNHSANNVCRPVSPSASGAGLPYAPEGWPKPDDVWGWKVGKRVGSAGYYQDRYLFPPRCLQMPSYPKRLQSILEVERFLKKYFPEMDLKAFLDLFTWKVPSNKAAAQSVSVPLPVKSLETKNEETEEIGVQRKRKLNAKSPNEPTQKSVTPVFPPIEQDEDPTVKFCSINEQASPPIESTKDLHLKGISGSKSDQFLSCYNDSPENDFVSNSCPVASKEESDIQTVPEKSPNVSHEDNYDDFYNSLEDITILPSTKSSLIDSVMSNTAVENEKTNFMKLSMHFAMDFSYYLTELSNLASQLGEDSSIAEEDQVTNLKLIEEIPLISKDFLEAKRNLEQDDKLFADLEAMKAEVTSLKKEDGELKDKVAEIQAGIDSSVIAIQEIDNQILQLQSKRDQMLRDLETKKKIKAELTSTQTKLAKYFISLSP